ncbi:MFS transporter [Oceanobacillus polygoni]|uniref:ACS family hexuronate transporter-like MFS transporter n=1 Tax=Oceanobacillus polygoni TaxID=1235259 RepID=A0A9X0YQM9_9BACI|nr:MFS transporter [Oceanobacillus polygoni]MBP2076042.1 ACS family hexuronate transporter-like MFS transporter [Oceanobacillus polygoni]
MLKHNVRWIMLLLVTLIFFIQFVDRVIISLATEPMMEEFGFTPSQWGIILSAFFWGLVPFSIIAGLAADKYGSKKVFLVGSVFWSICTAGTALAFNFVSLLIARILFGAGEGPSLSNGVRIVTNWFSPREYSSALGVAFAGVYLGPALASPIIVWMIASYGWRTPFYVMGVIGILWAICWYKVYTDRPEKNRFLSNEEKAWILSEQGEVSKSSDSAKNKSLKELLTIPKGLRGTIFANLWGFFCVGYALFFLLTWLPGYLSIERGLSLQSMGWALTVPWIGAAFGQILGGRCSDLIYSKTNSRRIARAYWSVSWFAILTVSLIFVVQIQSVLGAVVFLTISSISLASAAAPLGAVIAETVPENAGSFGGLSQVAQTMPGILAPIITGFIVELTSSFNMAFYLTAIIVGSGVIILGLFSKPPEKKVEDSEITPRINVH